MAVTLDEIAKRLGVSTVTVSNALSGKKGLSDKLREDIMRTAEEMGYKKQKRVKKVLKEEGKHIAVVVPERYLEMHRSFYWELYQKVAYAASLRGCFTTIDILNYEFEQEDRLPRILSDLKTEGIIVVGWVEKHYSRMLKNKVKLPMVYLDYYDENITCDAVVSNNYYGMYQITNYMIHMGHKKIGFVGTTLATGSIMDRFQGFVKAMLEHGLSIEDKWIIDDRDVDTGNIQIKLPEELPEAFVCNSDFTAGIMSELLEERGYQIPADISLAGYDNYLYDNSLARILTTYDVEMEVMAEQVLDILLDKIKTGISAGGIHITQGKLLVRNSVRKL